MPENPARLPPTLFKHLLNIEIIVNFDLKVETYE